MREIETSTTTRSLDFRALRLNAIPGLPPGRAHQDPPQALELLQAASRAEDDGLERRLGYVHGHPRLVPEPLVQTSVQRSPTGEHDPLVHDVGRPLGRGPVEPRL